MLLLARSRWCAAGESDSGSSAAPTTFPKSPRRSGNTCPAGGNRRLTTPGGAALNAIVTPGWRISGLLSAPECQRVRLPIQRGRQGHRAAVADTEPWSGIRHRALGSCTVAMTRRRPLQQGQARTSGSNTRHIRAVQVHAPGVPRTRGWPRARARCRPGSGGRSERAPQGVRPRSRARHHAGPSHPAKPAFPLPRSAS